MITYYDYILTSRFQSDPTEHHFSKYRQMSGGHFLVSLREKEREVNNSEKILLLNSIIKADLKFWEENIYAESTKDSASIHQTNLAMQQFKEISEFQLNEGNKEVAVSIVGHVAKILSSRLDCNQCKEKLIFSNKDNGHNHGKYLNLISH